MARKGFYIYILENWCGDSCDIVCAFKCRTSAELYLKNHLNDFYSPYIRKLWVNL